MRDRKKRNIIIGTLCCLLVFMGIGYAILSQTLNISGIANMKGSWNVKITNMELLEENTTGKAVEVSHSFTDTTATFETDLYMPGDSIEYRVTVENQGNIDALLKSITPTTTNKSEGIKFSHSEIDNTVLTAGKTITFTMKVEFLEEATSIPNVESVKYNLELVYVQYDGKSEYTPVSEANDTSCFAIDDDGTIISYNYDLCGTDIVVPAKINNIPVKNISKYNLTYSNATKTSDNKYVMDSQEEYDNLKKQKGTFYRKEFSYSINSSIDERVKETGKTREEVVSELLEMLKEEIPTITTLDEYIDYVVNSQMEGDSWKDGYEIYVKGASDSPTVSSKMTCTYNEEKTKAWSSGGQCIPIYYFDEDGNYEGELSDSCATYGETTSSYNAEGSSDLLSNNYSYEAAKKYLNKKGNASYVFLDDDGDGAATMDNYNYGSVESCEGPNRVLITVNDELSINITEASYFKMTSLDLSQAIYMEEIMPYAFSAVTTEDNKITLKLPSNLKTIGESAFLGSVTGEVLIPKNVENIKTSAFSNGSITAVRFESNGKLKTIGVAAFGANNISNLTLPNNIESIELGAFAENKITAVTLPQTLKNIYAGAFFSNELTSITIPKNVKVIGEESFGSNKITSLNFEDGTTIEYLNGFNNNLLQTVTIPKTVTEISHTAFTNNKITKINYESGINLKYLSGFEGNLLTSIEIPSTVKTIGYNAFTNNKLTTAGVSKLPSGLQRMLKDSFKGNSDLTQITLTSPVDIDGWVNGSTVDGKKVVYER